MVSRVVGTGLIIAGGDCVSGSEGSFGGLQVGLSCGMGRGHLGALGWWPLALGRVAGPLWHGWWCWALVSGRWGLALSVPGGSGLPWARHSMGGLVQVLVLGWLLWDLRCVRRFFFVVVFLGC